MIFRSIVGKLWVSIVILFIVVLSALGIFLSQVFDNFYLDLQEKNLITKADKVARIIQMNKDEQTTAEEIELVLDGSGVRIAEPTGLVRHCSPGVPTKKGMRLDEQDIKQLQKGQTVVHRKENVYGVDMITAAVPIMSNGKVTLAVQTMSPLETINETTGRIKIILIGTAFGAIILATILSFIVSKKLSRPLVEMNKVASEMRKKNFDEKISYLTDNELGRLGNTLNILSGELKQTLEALSNEKDQLKNILASMTDGVITFSAAGQIIMINPRASVLFNVEENLPVGKKLDECCPIPELKEIYQKVLHTGMAQMEHINWADQVLAVRMSPLKDGTGLVRGVVAVVQDITKEHQLEKMRKDFMANVSHELRNPLFLLQGYGEALLHDVAGNKEEQEEIVKIIVDETMRLQRLVRDILDLANLESDKVTLHKEKISITEIISGIIKRYQQLASEKGVVIYNDFSEDIPAISADADRITQVMINLMDNALRYCKEDGQITLKITTENELLVVSVHDNGPGIPEEDLPYVWERFYKVEKSRNRKNGGTGLGLAIVKKIIEAHGGNINIESKVDCGTTVIFRLPL